MLFGSKILVKDHLNRKVQYWLSACVAGGISVLYFFGGEAARTLGSRLRRSLRVDGPRKYPGHKNPACYAG